VSPISNFIASPVALRRNPVRSWGWFENLSNVCICVTNCSVNRFGRFTPHSFSRLWAKACGKVQTKPADGSPCAKMGDMIALHCSEVNVVAASGYNSFLKSMFCRLTFHSRHPNCELFIFHCHSLAVSTKSVSSVSMLPSGANWTPSV